MISYCVPGVTSARCRGTFWETGKLYQKDQEGGALSPTEYTAALRRINELRSIITELRPLADAGEVTRMGELAATARIELRQVGKRVTNSLAGDERIDSERRLFATIRVLDNLDIAALQSDEGKSSEAKGIPAEFSLVVLLLTQTAAAFDEFLRYLPSEPDEYAT